jgi:hypothetical protein
MIFNLTRPDKISPSLPLVIHANVTAHDNAGEPRLRWTVWRNADTGFIQAFDFTSGNLLDSSVDGENLVIRPGVLSAGTSYRVCLEAAVGQAVAQAEIFFTTNVPPIDGSLTVSPTVGEALNSTFVLRADGFVDTDMPLTYRFGHRRSRDFTSIALRSTASMVSVMLPAGNADAEHTYLAALLVYDLYSASAESTATVTVRPYEKRESDLWSNTVHRLVELSNDSPDLLQIAELGSCLASELNSPSAAATSATDLELSRRILVRKLANATADATSASTMLNTEGAGIVLNALDQMTVASDQLSSDVVETSASLLRAVVERSEDIISTEAAGAVARVSSNLVRAGMLRPENAAETQQATVEAVMSVLGTVSQSIANTLVANQNAFELETPLFSMQIARISISSLAGVRNGPKAVAQLPASELPTDLQMQTVTWNENPFVLFTGDTPVGRNEMSVSRSVLTVNLFSGGETLNVSQLNTAVHVSLSTGEIDSNYTDNNVTTCARTACVNRYDLDQRNGHACSSLLDSGSYSCSQHFCRSCPHAGYCDHACGFGRCKNSSGEDDTASRQQDQSYRSWCRLPAVPACSYLDTSVNRWKLDGELVATSETQVTCAFNHLTDFAVCLGPPPKLRPLAPPGDTLNLVQFFRENPAGLITSALMLVLLFATCCRALARDRTELSQEGGQITHIMLNHSTFAQHLRSLHTSNWPFLAVAITQLRTKWTCGSLWLPIEGDPMTRRHRQLISLVTVHVTLAVNGLFFRLGNAKEICETTEELGANCTAELMAAGLCICKTCKSTHI